MKKKKYDHNDPLLIKYGVSIMSLDKPEYHKYQPDLNHPDVRFIAMLDENRCVEIQRKPNSVAMVRINCFLGGLYINTIFTPSIYPNFNILVIHPFLYSFSTMIVQHSWNHQPIIYSMPFAPLFLDVL